MRTRRHDEPHDDFGGLLRDLRSTGAVMDRRQVLRYAANLGALALLGCNAVSDLTVGDDSCGKTPEETAGPFPGDSSNGPSVLNLTGVVRSDIRSSFAGLNGTADGVPLSVVLNLVSSAGCARLAARAVYLWHCDRAGRYSLYSNGVTNQNYLRGVQETDANGRVTFTTTFPGCYSGRWPHIHFEVYPSLAAATSVANKIATSQLALPKSVCDLVYATAGYEASIPNLAQTSLATDNVFGDGATFQVATMSGTVGAGLTGTLQVGV